MKNTLIEPRSDTPLFFNDGLTIGSSTGFTTSYEVLNKKEKRLFGRTFKDIRLFENGMTGFEDNQNRYGIMNTKGKVVI